MTVYAKYPEKTHTHTHTKLSTPANGEIVIDAGGQTATYRTT